MITVNFRGERSAHQEIRLCFAGYRASYHPIILLQTKRIRLNLVLQSSFLSFIFTITLGYLNPALNNLALDFKISNKWFLGYGFTNGHYQENCSFLLLSRPFLWCLFQDDTYITGTTFSILMVRKPEATSTIIILSEWRL